MSNSIVASVVGRRVARIAALIVAVPVILIDLAITVTVLASPTPASRIDVATLLLQPALVMLGAAVVVTLAGHVGGAVGRRLEANPQTPSVVIGLLGGLALLALVALLGGGFALAYGYFEQTRSLIAPMPGQPSFVESYGFKTAAIIAFYGWPVAALGGAISAAIIRSRLSRAEPVRS
jgi:hypothetical protein